MSYQVLARAFRPQTFSDLLGQDAVVQTLRNALSGGTLAHAYLFSGLRGVGKTTAARLLAKAVNCERGPTPEPCGTCVSCVDIAAGSSLDVVELDAATHTGVDDVRELQEFLRFHPTRDRFRVMIVDEVHMLSKAAFNALLKTIEEPPPYVLWIFATTERSKVPATVLSRCQQLEFRPLPLGQVAGHLEMVAGKVGFSLTPGAAGLIARVSGGSVRDALSLLDQLRAFSQDRVDEEGVAAVLGVPRLELVADLVGSLAAGDAATGLELLRSELVAGRDPTALYQETGRVLRLLLHLALATEATPELTAEQRAELERLARGLGVDPLTRMLGLWLEHEGLLKYASNRELALEVACLRLSRWPAVQQLEAALSAGSGGAAPSRGTAPSRDSSGPASNTPPRSGGARPRSSRSVAPPAPETPPPAVPPPPPEPDPAPSEPPARTAPKPRPGHDPLRREAEDDPQVRLVRGILGGEIVSVRTDTDEG